MHTNGSSTESWTAKAEQAVQDDSRAQPWKELLGSGQVKESNTDAADRPADYMLSKQFDNSGCSVCGSSSCSGCCGTSLAG